MNRMTIFVTAILTLLLSTSLYAQDKPNILII